MKHYKTHYENTSLSPLRAEHV